MYHRNNRTVYFYIIVLIIIISGCSGPSPEEITRNVYLISPIVFLLSFIFLVSLFKLWQRKYNDLKFQWPVPLLFFILLAIFSLFQVINGYSIEKFELALFYIWIFGTSYLTFLFVVWRIWFQFNPIASFKYAPVISMSLILFPAFPILYSYEENLLFQPILMVWIFAGYLGIVSGSIYLGLVVEAIIRTKNRNSK